MEQLEVTINDLLMLIGRQAVEINQLRAENAALRAAARDEKRGDQ